MGFRVLLDTNVLVPAALRDTLLRAAVRDLYEPCWSAEILAELERVLVREGMTTSDRSRYLTDTLQVTFPNAMTPNGYKKLTPIMENDENDRHVLAAAVFTRAQSIEVLTPDAFLVRLYDIEPDDMCESIIRQVRALKLGNYTVSDILDNLGQHAP